MIRIGILGATGYTALELIKLLLRHPEARITALTSRQAGEPHVAAVHPGLVGRLELRLRDLSPEQVAAKCDACSAACPTGRRPRQSSRWSMPACGWWISSRTIA